MQGKFIYVFGADARDKLLSAGYLMLKSDKEQGMFIFENKENITFAEKYTGDFTFVLSNTLTF